MVKVKEEAAMAETKAAAATQTATNNTTNNTNNNNSANTNNNNNNSNNHNSILTHHAHVPRKPRNHFNHTNHNHNHHHLHHQTFHHFTYFHHHCTYPTDSADSNGATSPAKFYFGPGFEPQNQSPPGVEGGSGGGYAPGPSQVQGNSGEYVVLFHVNPGVTINFQYGDTLEVLRGPVTVPMVSTNSSPPIAMPVQVPPGHVVQQIVDESGTLRHVILSPQHPAGLVPLPSHNPQHYGAGPANGTNQAQQAAFYQGFPPPHFHANMPPGHPVPSPTHLGHSPPPNQTYYKDERTQRQHIKLRKKIQDKQKLESIVVHKELMVNGLRRPTTKDKEMNSVGTSEDGEESSIPDEEDSVQIIADILSSVQAPKVSELSSRSALLQWAPPTKLSEAASSGGGESPEIDVSDLRYEVLLSDKSKEMKFKSIYSGASLSCRIQDLRPGQEYSVCLQVHYEELQGSATDPIKFTTPPCEPDQPQPPKLHQRQKNGLHLKWNAVNDNGAYILNYILEYDEGKGGDFVEFHKGRVKQHILHKLQPATVYRFRLAAVNDVGRSAYSDVVAYSTCNNPPARPAPPNVLEAFVNSLHLQWAGTNRDDDYTLQMNDPNTKYYMVMYHGKETHYLCTRLNNFTQYKFRLRAENDGGASSWSEEVTFCTLPDRPARPSKPVVKGRIHAHSFKLKWEPPSDTGGAAITEYVLEVNSGSGYETVYKGTETEAVCDKLTPGTTYQLRVSCVSQGGASNYSDPCTVTTDAIGPGQCPQPRLHGKPKANAVTVRWPEPDYNGGAPVLEYEVEMTSPDGARSIIHKSRETECTALGLSPGCPYSFAVRAVNRIGAGHWSEALRVTSGAAPPDAPQPPTPTCKSPFHAFVEWQEPRCNGAPVLEYRLEMSPNQDQDDHFHFLYQGADTSHDVKGLNPFSTYYFRLQACNSAGFSPFSPTAATVTPAAPPSTVTTLRHEATPTSLSLSWTEPANNGSPITHYNVEVGDRLVCTEGPVTELLLDNLQPETNYKVKIQAVNAVGAGSMSPTLRTSTLRLPPRPPKLECTGSGHNYLKLKWGEGRNVDYTQYTVEMESPRSHDFQCVYKGTAFMYKVNKLHESMTYKFRICASNDAGTGDYSETYEFVTGVAPPAALKQPKLVEVDHRSCVIEWTPGKNSFPDSVVYLVQVSRLKDQSFKQVYKGSESKCSIDHLEPGTEYSARVCPIRIQEDGSSELSGPHSPPLTVVTPSLEPPVSVSKLSSTSSSSPSHSHKNQNLMATLLQTVHLRQIPNTPAFYAFLLMFLGIVMAIGLSFYLTNLNNNNNNN